MGFTFWRRKPCESLDCMSEAALEIAYRRLRALGMFRTPHESHLMRDIQERLKKFGVEH